MRPDQDDLFQIHRPVMVAEVLEHLFQGVQPSKRCLILDGTVGLGGHAEAILRSHADTEILGLDRDGEALERARRRL